MITLVITGVGGPLGQALIKAARLSAIPSRIVGTDRSDLSIGLDWVESPQLLPDSAEPEAYVAAMKRVCAAERATLILPGSDRELAVLSAAASELREATGAIVVASAPEVLQIGLDKAETSRFLEAAGLAFPRTSLLTDDACVARLVEDLGFPLIGKPCRGSGSRGLFKVRSWEDVRYLRTLGTEMVLQEYLEPDDAEFTVAVYTQRDGQQAGSICFKRELVAGNTYRAWVDQEPAVLRESEAIVRALRPSGPCNIQLRLTARGAVAFEINPRFSGTTAMRAHFGYNEVEMAIRDFGLGEPVPAPVIRPGIALRFWDEVYKDAEVGRQESLAEPSPAAAMVVLTTDRVDEWMSVLERATQHDFYYLPAYHALAEQRGEGEARLFVYEQEGYMLALPLMLRRINSADAGAEAKQWRDATSVYGYAGPLASDEQVPALVIRAFQEALEKALRELRVVSAFSRLHPLIPQHALLAGLGECRPGGQTVSVDLALPTESQRAQYRSNVKSGINRLRRAGVTCAVDPRKEHLGDFISIYHETMRRVGAQNAYFFEDEYFTGLVERLGPTLELFVVTMPSGEVVAGGLFTFCNGIVQYHLGGTRDAALKLSPMALVFETVRLWALERGARFFHLGGGVGSSADSLFRFKAGFSDSRHDFATWRWIIMPDVYHELTAEREQTNAAQNLDPVSAQYFPAYRSPALPRIEPCTTDAEAREDQIPEVATHG